MTANDDLFDATIRHEFLRQRYTASQTRVALKMLRDIEDRINRELLRRPSRTRTERLEKLLARIRAVIKKGYDGIEGRLYDELRALSRYEAQYQADLFRRVVPVQIETLVPSEVQIWAAVNERPFSGRILKDWFKGVSAGAMERVEAVVRNGYAEGRDVESIVRDLRGTRANNYKDGVIERNRRFLKTAVRSAVGHTAQAARMRTIEDNSDLVKGVIWRSTLDTKTSAICRPRDGKKYDLDHKPVGHKFRWLGGPGSAHPNCRSTPVPWLKSWKELGINLAEAPAGTRASMGGQVPDDMTFSDWLMKQPIESQVEALGREKARLFRQGLIPLDSFYDGSGHEYTLEQLAERDLM